jgi:hypothetical protein
VSGPLAYQLRLRDPFDTTDVLVVSTVPTDTNPFITQPPEGDGTKIDPLTGRVEVGEYVVRIADEIGTLTLPTLIFQEDWLYEDQAARNVVWPKSSSGAAPYAGGDNGGFDGNPLHVGVINSGLGGFAQHEHTESGLTPGVEYTVVCDWMTLSRPLGVIDNCGMSLNGGEALNPHNTIGLDVLEGPVIGSAIADGSGEITIACGHFGLEFGMEGIVITFGRIRIFGPGEELETRVVTGWLADEDAQLQALGVKAILSESTNDGEDWTAIAGMYVTHVELAGGIEWAITLGESDRRERSAMVFTREEGLFEATRIVGAPTGFGPLEDAPFDEWRFTVAATGDTSGNLPSDAVVLDFDRGWMYATADTIAEDAAGLALMDGSVSNYTKALIGRIAPQYAETVGGVTTLTGLTARVYSDSSGQAGALLAEAEVYGWSRSAFDGAYKWVGKGPLLMVTANRIALKWLPGDGGTISLPADGTVLHVVITPDVVSEDNPLHWTGHLVDFVRELFNIRQIEYDATSADTVKAALGQMRAYYRFTEAEPLMEAAEKYAFGPGGFAVRPTPEGEWEFIVTRHLPTTAPSETLDGSEVHDPETVIFSAGIDSIVNQVVWNQQHWTVWNEEMEGEPPADGIIGRDQTTIITPEMAGFADRSLIANLGVRELVYDLPGEIIIKSGSSPKVSAASWFLAMGSDILRRWGRGCASSFVRALRGMSDALLGDFITLDLDHRPNAFTGREPTSQRIGEGGGQRIVQVVHRTLTPAGPEYEVLDVGPTVSATELVPEFDLDLTSDDPRHTAEATLTNHGDLAGFLVRMEMGTGSVEPDGGVTVEVFTPDDLPHRTFPEEACTTVWVRMRAEPEGGGVPGAWSDWQSEDLDCIPAVTGLSADAGGNCTEEAITWTVGDADLPVRVRWKLTAATDYTNVVTLPAGSDQYVIGGLVPGSAYTVEVAHLDISPFSGAGTVATDTWTACGDVPVLNPPIDPLGFTNGAGTYGMEVTGTEFPSNTVFEEAIETAAGSGTYGAYSVVASPATTAGRIHFESFRASDALTVRIRAKHTRSGWTDSAYTTPVIVDPWGDPNPIPPGGGVAPGVVTDTFSFFLGDDEHEYELTNFAEAETAVTPIWRGYKNLTDAQFARLEGRVTEAGNAGAELYCTYSLDDGDTWEDALDGDAGPTLPLDVADDVKSFAVVEVEEAAQGEVLLAVFGRGGNGTADPVVTRVRIEFLAKGEAVELPDDTGDQGATGCSGLDTYPVSRGLEAWHLCDCGDFSSDGTGLKIADRVYDLTDNSNDLVADLALGSSVKRITDADGAAVAQLNGRDVLSFKDAFLEWPTDLFDGFTEGELFMVVRGNAGDPATNDRNYFHMMGPHTGPNNQARWALDTGGGANTGEIVENFGSDTLRATGGLPGVTLTDWHIYNVRATTGSLIIALDEVVVGSTGNVVAWSSAPRMGSRSENSHVHVAEIAIHNVILTTTERDAVVAKLRDRWAL